MFLACHKQHVVVTSMLRATCL